MWTEYRAEMREMFLTQEITGFQNYSLMDAGKYNYSQLTERGKRCRLVYH